MKPFPDQEVDSSVWKPDPIILAPLIEGHAPAPTLEPWALIEDALLGGLLRHARACSPRRARDAGEPVGVRDDINITRVAWREGVLVPASALERVRLTPQEGPDAEVFLEVVAGTKVGADLVVTALAAPDGVGEDLPPVGLRWLLRVEAAWEVDERGPDDPGVLDRSGCETLETLVAKVAAELEDAHSAQQLEEAEAQALDAALSCVNVPVSDEEIASKITVHFQAYEGPLLERLGCPDAERTRALESLLEQPGRRAEVGRGLRASKLLDALAASLELEVGDVALEAYVRELAKGIELDGQLSWQTVKREPQRLQALRLMLRQQAALQWWMGDEHSDD